MQVAQPITELLVHVFNFETENVSDNLIEHVQKQILVQECDLNPNLLVSNLAL